jgi:hypothetical protein
MAVGKQKPLFLHFPALRIQVKSAFANFNRYNYYQRRKSFMKIIVLVKLLNYPFDNQSNK